MIQKLLSLKNEKLEKQEYLKTIIDPLAIALEFYKEQSDDNYKRIIEGIQSEQITLLEKRQSYIDTKSGKTYILLNHEDSDVFCLVHEFAHFIDHNHKPAIVPDSHWFLVESYAFYMEKRLEKFLSERGYHALVQTRRNNCIVSETKMLTAIENQLFYEEQYQKTKNIETISFDTKKIKTILPYHMTNLVNVLLSYPLANILSEYLINHYGTIHNLSPYFINSLYAVDRAVTWHTELASEYQQGKIVLLDRYTTSSIIYQSAEIDNRREKEDFIHYVTDFEYHKNGIASPDETIFLWAPYDLITEIRNKRTTNEGISKDIHERDDEYMRKVYDSAMYVADYLSWHKVQCNDGDKMRPIEDIQEEIHQYVKKK